MDRKSLFGLLGAALLAALGGAFSWATWKGGVDQQFKEIQDHLGRIERHLEFVDKKGIE